jgi:hypothetical protein
MIQYKKKRKSVVDVGGKKMNCSFCHETLDITGKVSRSDTCPHCDRDLRCCKQCKFFDPSAYNECREVVAERITDKDRANFCDYYVIRGSKGKGSGSANRTKEAKQALEDLFKKK